MSWRVQFGIKAKEEKTHGRDSGAVFKEKWVIEQKRWMGMGSRYCVCFKILSVPVAC